MHGVILAMMMAGGTAAEPGWLRPVWNDAGGRLEVAARAYEPVAGGPRVWLVGVIHIGEPGYYEAVEGLLAQRDAVIFESVLPAGGTPPGGEDDTARAEHTAATAKLLARLFAGGEAADWNGAMAALALREPRMVGIARPLNRDGWGRPWVFTQAEGDAGRHLLSYGSDGMPAGECHAADIAVEIAPEPAETGGDGIQQTMAESLGLMFQLDGLPYGTPSWIPGDMSIDEISVAFKERGQRIEDLTDLLDGKGLFGGLIRGIFGVIPTLDAMFGGRVVDTMHVMLIETLGNESTIDVALAMQGPAFKEVLLDLRNERAMDVMDAKIRDAPAMESIAVLYGAGHLPGLTELLCERGAYEVVDEQWFPAITLELDDSALTRTEIDMLRGWVGVIGRQLHKGSGGGGPE
jgi:hypothetical protein